MQWREDALKAGIPLCKYIYEMVERGREQSKGQSLPSDLLREAEQTREDLARLHREVGSRDTEIAKLQTDLFTLKNAFFLQPAPTGSVQLSSGLVDLLQDGHVWRSDEILRRLGVDTKNIDAIGALAGQLHALQDLRLVEETAKGWRWIR